MSALDATLRKVFHPSDFTPASELAFRHALKIAVAARAELTMLHVAEHDGAQWSEFPSIRRWLERWQLIPEGSPRDAVARLGLAVHKVMAHSNDALRACLHYLEKHPADLVVLSAQQRETLGHWPTGAEEARPRHPVPATLFLPATTGGFVTEEEGKVQLHHILVPLAAAPNPQAAVNAAVRLARSLELHWVDFILVHVGEAETVPRVRTPALPGWTWRCDLRAGEVGQELLDAVDEHAADLVALSTDGQHGFLDAVRGQITSRLLRDAHCPLLAVAG
jgi:nucleotide-binding universal stress UspA family protein